MSYKLFLDDIRQPKDVKWVDIGLGPFEIVRNYSQFVNIIETKGLPSFIAFDHDLADEHYNDDTWDIPNYNYKEKTGYDCALFLVEYCKNNSLELPKWIVHSLNPVGAQRIRFLLRDDYKYM